MRQSSWTPSIVPTVKADKTVYLVLDDLGEDFGEVWREADAKLADRATVFQDIIDAQYSEPVRIVAFDPDEEWLRDVTVEMATDVRRHFERAGEDVPSYLREFVERHVGRSRQLSLRLA